MNKGALISTGFFILGAAALLLQLWFSPWSADVFLKIIISIGVLFIVSLVISFLLSEAQETKKLNEGKDL